MHIKIPISANNNVLNTYKLVKAEIPIPNHQELRTFIDLDGIDYFAIDHMGQAYTTASDTDLLSCQKGARVTYCNQLYLYPYTYSSCTKSLFDNDRIAIKLNSKYLFRKSNMTPKYIH